MRKKAKKAYWCVTRALNSNHTLVEAYIRSFLCGEKPRDTRNAIPDGMGLVCRDWFDTKKKASRYQKDAKGEKRERAKQKSAS